MRAAVFLAICLMIFPSPNCFAWRRDWTSRKLTATWWGANAVNGVINVITKNAKDTRGGRVTAGSGNLEEASGAFRYGAGLCGSIYFRIYGQGFKRDNFPDSSGDDVQSRLRLDPESADADTKSRIEGSSPEHQFHLLSRFDLPNNLELDASLYFIDRLPDSDIPAYARLDLRLGWTSSEGLEVSVVGQNLLDRRHPEFSELDLIPSEAPRSVYGRVTWRFP